MKVQRPRSSYAQHGLAIPAALLWSLCLAAALWRHTTATG